MYKHRAGLVSNNVTVCFKHCQNYMSNVSTACITLWSSSPSPTDRLLHPQRCTLWDKKRNLFTFVYNSGRYWRIFEIFSLLNSSANLQQSDWSTTHRILNVLLHYLVKWQLSKTKTFSYQNNCSSDEQTSFYDKVQMQVIKTVQNLPLLHGHRH